MFSAYVCNMYTNACNISKCDEIHFIFDSYIPKSLKNTERYRRQDSTIELDKIDDETPMPKQLDKFWGSSKNKVLFQQYSSDVILRQACEEKNQLTIASGTIQEYGATPAVMVSNTSSEILELPALCLNIEEADIRIIPHIKRSALRGQSKITVISNDTDALVLLLH